MRPALVLDSAVLVWFRAFLLLVDLDWGTNPAISLERRNWSHWGMKVGDDLGSSLVSAVFKSNNSAMGGDSHFLISILRIFTSFFFSRYFKYAIVHPSPFKEPFPF